MQDDVDINLTTEQLFKVYQRGTSPHEVVKSEIIDRLGKKSGQKGKKKGKKNQNMPRHIDVQMDFKGESFIQRQKTATLKAS